MFWDTWDYWTDDRKTKKIKSYRRKSNYYEKKSNNLEDYLTEINSLIRDAESHYNLGKRNASTEVNDVMKYKYYQAESNMYSQTESILSHLKAKRDILKNQLQVAKNLWKKYYNLAIKEDY